MDTLFKIVVPCVAVIGTLVHLIYSAVLSKEKGKIRFLTGVASVAILFWAVSRLSIRLHIPPDQSQTYRVAIFHVGDTLGGIGAGVLFALLTLGYLRTKQTAPTTRCRTTTCPADGAS